ncbi:Hint domain-containing protein [Photorhabdus sp. CRCIA-P01]|uniref:Hint domain-containing protein n=1 Tax=Photorhabdus sp. CRCIA-P01 TaxID=2019570 RepID=UPI000E59B6FE|nr:Hint domain-containing protein [Photorhabdus sp. CRCIA-P01]
MTLYNRIFIFFIMMFAPIISSFADTEIKLSDEQSQAISQLLEKIEPNKPTLIDLTKSENEKGYIALLHSHGITKQKNPDIFKDIEIMKANQKTMFRRGELLEIKSSNAKPEDYFGQPTILISDGSKSISAEVLGSLYFPGSNILNSNTTKTDVSSVSLQGGVTIYGTDKKNGKFKHLISSAYKPVKNEDARDLLIDTKEYDIVKLEKFSNLKPVATFQGKRNGISITNGPVIIRSNTLTDPEDIAQYFQPHKMNNTAPTHVKNPLTKPVIVCLNRANPEPGADSQCDYGPTSPGNPTIKLEIIGDVTFKNPIAIDEKGKPTEFQGMKPHANLTLIGLDTGGACKLAKNIDEDTFWKHTEVNNDPARGNNTKLSWDFSKNTGYADFGPICWKNNERYVLDLQVTVPTIQGDTPFSSQFTYTNNRGHVKNESQFIYPPIQIQYGCIAEGTLIDMADGSKWKVENIRPGDKVLTKQGGILQVKSRIVGHDTEFIDLIYNNGEQVSLTPTHPVSTLRGIVKTDELKIGDTIHTRDGQTTLTSVKQRKSEPSNVYNFVLEKTDSQNELLPEDAVLFAGGILVGDNNLQRKVSISN